MKLKKWIAAVLVGVMSLTFTGCLGNFYDNVMTVNGKDISAGMYLMLQQTAYNEAQTKREDEEASVFKQKIDGISASKWITQQTEEWTRKMICVEELAAEKGVFLSDTSKNEISQTMESYWPYLEESYTENGIGKEAFQHYLSFTSLEMDLFKAMYGVDGEMAPSDEEMKKEYLERFAHLRYLGLPNYNMEDAEKDMTAETAPLVEKMVEELDAGVTLEEVIEGDTMKELYELLGREYNADTLLSSISPSYYREYVDESGTYSQEFLDKLKAQNVGDHGYYQMESTYLLYEKIPPFESDEAFTEMRDTVVESLYFDTFEEYLKSIYDEYPVSKAFLAEWYFRPTKLE